MNTYRKYERYKRRLSKLKLTPAEYERRLKGFAAGVVYSVEEAVMLVNEPCMLM
jgi:hypothetical protein